MDQSDSNSVGERSARRERKSTPWERVKMAARALVSAPPAHDTTPRMREAGAADSSAKDLVVRSLTIVDEQGNRRIRLDTIENTPCVLLYDEKGKPRAALTVNKDRTSLSLYDEKGKPRALA